MAYDFMSDTTLKRYDFDLTTASGRKYTLQLQLSTDDNASDGYDYSINIDGTEYYYSIQSFPEDD